MDSKGRCAIWIEEAYCSRLLPMEKDLFYRYFNDTAVDPVESEEDGCRKFDDKSMLWYK
jgi:hypothetical protein